MVPLTMVDMPFGRVAEFRAKFEGLTIKKKPGHTNQHNERNAELLCGETDWRRPDDHFDPSGEGTSTGYKLTIRTETNVSVGIWWDGKLEFNYDRASGRWTMTGWVDESQNVWERLAFWKKHYREWLFCDPEAAMAIAISGLRCFAGSDDAAERGLTATANLLASSIEAQRPAIVASAKPYPQEKAADCTYNPLPEDDVAYPIHDF